MAEVLTYTKETINMIEKAQNEIARWVLGTNRSAAIVGLRAELRWKPIGGVIRKRKLTYWARVMRMSDNQ